MTARSGADGGHAGGEAMSVVLVPHAQPARSGSWGASASDVMSPATIIRPGGKASTAVGSTPGAAR